MSLYLKEKNDELQNIEKERREAEPTSAEESSVFKQRSKRVNTKKNSVKEAIRRKWKEAPQYTARILSVAGVLCVLAVMIVVAANLPLLSKAEEAEVSGWDIYPVPDTVKNCTFHKASGVITKLSDLKCLGVAEFDGEGNVATCIAGIETVDQLKAVLSGLSTTDRSIKVIFKLTGDLTLTDWQLDGGTSFEKDVFDGQGHTITCEYSGSKASSLSDNSLYVGLLFGKVSNATIRNLQVDIKNHERNLSLSDSTGRTCYFGMGGVCGVAENATFSDIEIFGGWKVKYPNGSTNFYTNGPIYIGLGGLIGTVQSGVTMIRCKDDSNIDATLDRVYDYSNDLGVHIWGIGGIIGQVVGTGNTVQACWGNGVYTYTDGTRLYDRKILIHCGTIVGGVGSGGIVSIQDSAGRDDMPIIALEYQNDSGNITVDNCYGETPYSYWKYSVKGGGFSYDEYYIDKNSDTGYLESLLSEKREPINSMYSNVMYWGYSSIGEHYLLHPISSASGNYIVKLENLKIGDPLGEEHKITVTGKISLLKETIDPATYQPSYSEIAFPENATAYLYMTTDGETDPRENAVSNDSVKGSNQNEIELSTSTKYSDTSENLTVRARIKVVFDEETNTDAPVWWSPLHEKEFDASDLYIDAPTLEVSMDNQTYEDFQATTAYPLGTTKLQLTGNGAAEYTMYYDFRDRSGLVLGETDSDSTIYWQTMTQKNKYKDPFTLTEDMVKSASSNKVYLYVLAHINKDNMDYYKLFEYEIVVFTKDKLISVTPISGNRIPNNSDISIRVGSGVEGEYPYDKINILISDEQNKYTTLEGEGDVRTYQGSEYKKGSGTIDDPWKLTVDVQLSGDPGQTIYIYAEPCVSAGYENSYGRFVIEYTYTIMEKASGLELDPSTITMAESGNPTGIPINEKIYMNSRGSSDIIVYSKEITTIEPEMVKDTATLNMLESAAVTSVGENAYYWESDRSILYVQSDNLWYYIYNLDGKIEVYGENSLSFDSSNAGKYVYVSAMLFSAGYDPSDSVTYRYQVNVQDRVAAPTALLADGSNINMNSTLFFNCEQGCVMYYTTDGKEPQLIVADDGQITAKVGTYRYQPMDGIQITPENGFAYGKDMVIKLIAYPVADVSSDIPVYNDDYKESELSTFTYKIREQVQVETPLAYPETEKDKMTVVVKGDSISLSCATSGADIYCTVNGSTPQVDDAYKYQGVLKVEGDYGGYFTVKVMAAKDGYKNSEVATYVYKIADKDTVSRVTAIPSTAGQVIAGDRIILSTTEPGADIYYTIDGNTPEVAEYTDENGLFSYVTSPATKYYDPSASIIVPEGSGYFVVQAIAVKYGMTNSPVTQFVYAYADSVGIPYGNPSSGTVTENTQVILRCAQEEAIIYYEVAYDGNEPAEPTTSSAVFSEQAPIVITRNTKIKAFTVYNRQSSPVVTLNYTLAQKMAAPTASVSSGSIVPSGTTVILSSGGGKVYYTTDGSDPMDSNNTAVNIGSSVVITGKAEEKVVVKACTKQSEATTSEMVTFIYQISRYPGGVITDTATGSTLPGGTSVHLMTDVTGGTIYYTTGSGSPITSGTAGNSVVLNGEAGSNITVKAVAIAPNTGMTGSYASFDYVLMEQLAAPHASVRDGSVLTEKTSIVLKANKGKIYFTIDGTNPTRASNEYTKPIMVSEAVTIKAIAIEEGSVSSEISTFSYTFASKAGEITASLPAGVVDAGAVVRLSCSTPDTVIYYTTDGTDPSRSAEEGVFVYDDKEGIEIHRSVTVKAVARRGNMCDSNILTLSYQVDEIPIEMEKDKIAQQEAEEGLKPTDTSNLESKHTQPMKESASDVRLNDFLSDIEIRGDEAIIPANATFRGKEVSISKTAETEAKRLLGNDYELVRNFSFSVYSNGEQIYPEGQIEIGIPIPEEYENADIAIVSINENNGVKVYNARREEGYVYAEVPYLNNFALAVAEKNGNSRSRMNPVPLMSAAAGSLVCVGIVMIIRTVRRRKRY